MPRITDEQEVLQRQNAWYIRDDPTEIVLVPYPESVSSAGGRTRGIPGTPRDPQMVRFIASDRQRETSTSLQEFNSEQTEVPLLLIGEVGLEVERGDRFTYNGIEYRVTEVQPESSAPYLRRITAFSTPPDGA